ncbi:MAG: 2Fe-2S iron-sulfur cluster-binding protein [Myxococcota bacterium]
MPRVTFKSHDGTVVEGEVAEGTTLLNAAFMLQALVRTTCGGVASCLECKIRVPDHLDRLSKPEFKEKDRLGTVFHITKERLACQARVGTQDVVVEIPAPPESVRRQRLERSQQTPPRKVQPR